MNKETAYALASIAALVSMASVRLARDMLRAVA